MVIFGRQAINATYSSFEAPHNYHIIFELNLEHEARGKFIRDQQSNPEHATYTVESEKLILPEMLESSRPFKANVYRGHFNRGGVKILENVTVEIKAVLYAQKLDASLKPHKDLQFFVFGNAREQYAVHKISRRSEFDQIIQVSADYNLLIDSPITFVMPDYENRVAGVSGNVVADIT